MTTTPTQISFQTPNNNPIQRYQSVQGQSIYDVLMQTYQSADLLVTLLKDNGYDFIPTTAIGAKIFIFDIRKCRNYPLFMYNKDQNIIYKTLFGFFNPELRDDFSYDLEDDGTISMRD